MLDLPHLHTNAAALEQHPMPPLIILAGGRSSRFGHPKGLTDYQGHPWLKEQMQRFKASTGTHIVIVVGYDKSAYASTFDISNNWDQWQHYDQQQIAFIVNPTPENGAFSSLQTGIRFLQQNPPADSPMSNGVFITPIDVPLSGPQTFLRLKQAIKPGRLVVSPCYQNQGGHPIYVDNTLLIEILNSSAHSRLDILLRRLPNDQRCWVDVEDPNILKNLNTPQDWHQFVTTEAQR